MNDLVKAATELIQQCREGGLTEKWDGAVRRLREAIGATGGIQYEQFQEVTDEIYDGCTTEQKLGVYIQHHPAAIVPFLLELILELHPEPVEEPNDTTRKD